MTPYPMCLECEMPILPGHLFVRVSRAGQEPGSEAPIPDQGPLVMHAGRCPAIAAGGFQPL